MRIQRRAPVFESNKSKSRSIWLYCAVIFLLSLVVLYRGRLSWEQEQRKVDFADAEFQVHVIDVGQGDSILVTADGHAMLIDAAEASAAGVITDYLAQQQITSLDYAVATHLHADHIGGFPEVWEAVKPEHIIEPICPDDLLPTSKTYERYLDAAEASGADYTEMQAGDSFTLGNAVVEVLAPVTDEAKDLNNTSLVLRVQYDDVVCLFTGDMENAEEETVLEQGSDLKADLLKVGHHGSDTSTGAAFLAEVRPSYAAISCGVDNSYGHPAKETLEKLAGYTDRVYITAEDGDIVFLYDKDTGNVSMTSSGKE